MKQVVSIDNGPAIGPFSPAIRAEGLVFVSGQVAVDPQTKLLIDGNVAAQTEQALKNLAAVLEAAGTGMEMVVRCSVYLTDLAHYALMNEVYGRYFPTEPPARTAVEVSRLPLNALVEIDAIALAGAR